MRYSVERPFATDALLRLEGDLRFEVAEELYHALVALERDRTLSVAAVDFSAVSKLDSPAAAALSVGRERLEQAGKRVEFVNLTKNHSSTFDLLPALEELPATEHLGRRERAEDRAVRFGRGLIDLSELVVDTIRATFRTLLGREHGRFASAVDQAIFLGVNAWWIVCWLSLLTGVILAFQAAYQLEQFGAAILMAEIVSLGMVREFAALMTAIILAGRSGSAIAAEIGTMAVREELDALRVIGVDPVSYLVFPRIAAISVVAPALTIVSMAIGVGSGILVAQAVGLPTSAIYFRMQETLALHDFWLGLSKSVLFAWIIGFTGCYMGLRTRGGPRSVGYSTTRTVVTAISLIVVTDSIVTTLWTRAGYGD